MFLLCSDTDVFCGRSPGLGQSWLCIEIIGAMTWVDPAIAIGAGDLDSMPDHSSEEWGSDAQALPRLFIAMYGNFAMFRDVSQGLAHPRKE